ncbi:outer membrane protein assembly factor BamA [Planctomycetota bacterium]
MTGKLGFHCGWTCILLFVVVLCLPVNAPAQEPADSEVEETVTDIRFFGLKRIRRVAIFPKLETRVGQPFSKIILNRDINRLYAWNQFEDIQVIKKADGPGRIQLEFQFVERDYVSSILFLGRSRMKQEYLEDLLTTQVGAPLKDYTLQDDIKAIQHKYHEKRYSLVDVQVQKIADGQGGVQVVFKISEGPRMAVRGVAIHGNEDISDRRLRRIMQNKKKFFFLRSGRFNFEMLEQDIYNLNTFYRSKGYLDAQVDLKDVVFSRDMKDVYLDINVEEGGQYVISDIRFDIQGDTPDIISKRELMANIRLEVGEPLLWEELQRDRKTVKLKYGALGRSFTKVVVATEYREKNNLVDLVFKINVSEEVFINRIVIRGNQTNRDKVIRRELSVYPGERINEAEFERSLARLRAMDYYEKITYDFYPSDAPGFYDLIIEVKEKTTGSMHFGAAFSMEGGVTGFMSITQRNFDIWDWPKKLSEWWPGRAFVGGGQRVQLKIQPGTQVSQILFNFREPYLFDRPVGLNVGARIQMSRFIDSDLMSSGFYVGLDRRFWRKFTIGTSYSMYRKDIYDVNPFAPPDVFAVKGVKWVHSWNSFLSYINVDDYLLPSKGWTCNLGYDYAGGFLGGNHNYYRLGFNTARYYTIYENDAELKHILALSQTVGYMKEHSSDKNVAITERFFAGGLTVRGFGYREIGPRQRGEPVGGTVIYTSTTEYTFPVPRLGEMVRGAVFVDTGNLAEDCSDFRLDDVRVSAGFGFRIKVPFLGQRPLRLDFGFPIKKKKSDERQLINFGFESNF